MKQVIVGGGYTAFVATRYASILGSAGGWYTSEFSPSKIVSTDGVIKNLYVKLDGSPAAGKSYIFTLMLNGNPTALTVTIANAETQGSDTTHEITVTGGDRVSIKGDPINVPDIRRPIYSFMFEGDNANESLLLGGGGVVDKVDIEYSHVSAGMCGLAPVAENDCRQICPTAGTIKNLYVELENDAGTAPDAYRFTLRKNGADQTLTVTITADDTTGNDLVNSFAVVAGDILTMKVEPLNSPSEEERVIWGMTFVATVDGESVVLGGSRETLHDTDTMFNLPVPNYNVVWHATEAQRIQLGQTCVIKKLYMLLSGVAGAGNKYTFTMRIAGGDSNVVVEIGGAVDTTGNSGALTDTLANFENLSLKVVPDDTPTARDVYWGFVCYIAPVIPIGSLTSLIPQVMKAIDLI